MIRAKQTRIARMTSESFLIEKALAQSLSDRGARSATRGLCPAIRRRRAESSPRLKMYAISEALRAFSQALRFRHRPRASELSWRMPQDRQRLRGNPSWDPFSDPQAFRPRR